MPNPFLIGALIFVVLAVTLRGRFKSPTSAMPNAQHRTPTAPIPFFEFIGFSGFGLVMLGLGITPLLAYTPILLLIGVLMVCVYTAYLIWLARQNTR